MAGSEHRNLISEGYNSGTFFEIDGPRVNKRDTPYLLCSLDMSDDDLDTLVDGQSSGKIAKDRKRAKSSDRSRKTTTEMFHTPGLPSREREGPVAIGMDSQQALQQMLASMMQMQLDADRRREEHEERDREE